MDQKNETSLNFKSLCSRVLSLFQPRQEPLLDDILSLEEFKNTLHKQMCRSDRSGRPLCVIAFDALNSETAEESFEHLIRLLYERKRCFDEIGWFERHRIGVILPDTEVEGSHRLAESIFLQIDEYAPDALDYRVYAYQPLMETDPEYRDRPTPHKKLVSTGTRRDQI